MTAELIKEFEPARGVMPEALASAQRISAAEEMAGTILYLASKATWYCNGSVGLVDRENETIKSGGYNRLLLHS
jgi:NAD(P)-dependent dehydrogenase (short-subunit alcohol dehydrogenase family)